MNRYRLEEYWLTIYTRTLRHRSEDLALLQTLRFAAFRQMLEPPVWDGAQTIIEGRPRRGAGHRLQALGFTPSDAKCAEA